MLVGFFNDKLQFASQNLNVAGIYSTVGLFSLVRPFSRETAQLFPQDIFSLYEP